ncbi:MAG: tyrosine-type recombinase/integrase [Cellvibrio sp.]
MKRSQIKRRPLADSVLASLEPETKEYRELDGEGLYFRVKPDGSKSWQLRYKRNDGSWSWLGLGGYGNGDHQLTGEAARIKARELKRQDRDGKDLLSVKRKIGGRSTNNTFEALAREWLQTKQPSWTQGTATRTEGALENHVFPTFGKRDFSTITPMEWMSLFRQMEQKGIIEQTRRTRGTCKYIYDLALVTGRVSFNPIEGLHRFLQSKPSENYAHVSLADLPTLIRAIHNYQHAQDVGIGLRLLAILACRPSELREATWSEFDLDESVWTIPAERMKRRREHIIPLPKQAAQLLRELEMLTGQYKLLFPGRSDKTKPRSDTVFLMALRRLGYQGLQTGHGFRHIASTILNENGFDPQHIEAQLSHTKEGVRCVYDKSIYLPQRRTMMQWYADYLEGLVN